MDRIEETDRALDAPINEGQIKEARRILMSHARTRCIEVAEDLVQQALADAVVKYDPSKGTRFSTFAFTIYMADFRNYCKKVYRLRLAPPDFVKRRDISNVDVARLYVKDKWSIPRIARKYECAETTIWRRLHKMGIDMRPRREKGWNK